MLAQGDDLVIIADRDTMRPEQPSSRAVCIWSPADCYTMTDPLSAAGLLSPKRRVGADLRTGRLLHWMLDRIEGK